MPNDNFSQIVYNKTFSELEWFPGQGQNRQRKEEEKDEGLF